MENDNALTEWARAKVAVWIRRCADMAAAELQAQADKLARAALNLRRAAR